MGNMVGKQASAPVRAGNGRTKAEGKERYVAYGLRGPRTLRDRCGEIAAEETRTVGYPVSVSAVMRKFIAKGCEAWGGGK
jgi:hypothetical protein